jgi:hypothetical protein
VEVIPTLTLDEILRRYHTDEPVDMARLRAEGEAAAADEVLSRIVEGTSDRIYGRLPRRPLIERGPARLHAQRG